MTAKVWIVDDDSSIRWVLERTLGSEGFECESFADGEALLSSLEMRSPDVILSDIRMPGIDGLSLLEQIHRQFIDVVKKGRGERLKETPEMFSGLFWTGEQSVALGLADDFGSLDSVARDVVKAEKLVDYTNKKNLAERFAKRFGAAMGEGAVKALQVAPSVR